MENVKILKSSQALVEGQLEHAIADRNQAVVDSEIAQAMQGLQSKEIMVVRQRCVRSHLLRQV